MLASLWRWIVSLLVWLSADPAALEQERPRAAAAVNLAAATLRRDSTPPAPPAPTPTDCACGGTCKNGVWKPDGRIEMPCPCPKACPCKSVSSASRTAR